MISRSEEHTSELQSRLHLVCRLLLEKKNASETTCTNCGLHAVWLAVSTDGGLTFTDHAVYTNPSTSVSYGHQFVNVSVDSAGKIYVIQQYTDTPNIHHGGVCEGRVSLTGNRDMYDDFGVASSQTTVLELIIYFNYHYVNSST